MVSIFEYSDFRVFIKKRFLEMPKNGYGQAQKLAVFLAVHTTLISQVQKGIKTFTLEQASLSCEFFGLNEMESEYFILLVQLDRAGNESLKKILKRQLHSLRQASMEVATRLKTEKKLSDEKWAVFYSDWTYSAIRQVTALQGFQTPDLISDYFGLSKKQTKTVIDFLLATGLCKESRGKITIGPSSTHLEGTSPWVRVHHMNWRQKAMEYVAKDEDAKLHYTAPLTLSKADALKVRELIIQLLEQVDNVIEPSPSEEVRCLNIDWFKVGG